MESDEGQEDEGPAFAWLPPDDRLWRHPSEIAGGGAAHGGSGSRPGAASPFFRGSPSVRTWTVAVVAGLIGAMAASGVGIMTGTFDHHTTVVQQEASTTGAPPDTLALASASSATDWPSITDVLSTSIVGLEVTAASGELTGSGVLYEGGAGRAYILTDSALLSQGGGVQVVYANGATATGHEVGTDPVTGIALLWAPGISQSFPDLGSVANLRPTEPVMALGARSPSGSAYTGTIISVDQHVDTTAGGSLDGAIALSIPGMPSPEQGGAVVDDAGEVVGISVSVTATDPTLQNLSFAVPIDVAEHVADQLMSGTSSARLTHPWLGIIDAGDVSSVLAEQMGITGGAQVGAVAPHSPAAQAGIGANDVITAFNGQPIETTGTLTQILARCAPMQRASISYLHGARRVTTWIVVGNLTTATVFSPSS